MGTLTAQFLVGKAHPNHGGINPTHCLFLSENSRPVLTLENSDLYEPEQVQAERITWFPTVERMLEDAIMMIGLHVIKDPALVEAWRESTRHHGVNSWTIAMMAHQRANQMGRTSPIELYRHVSSEGRDQLYALSRQMQSEYKITLSVFEGSTLLAQTPVLERYGIDVEVCTPQFIREYSSWSGKTAVRGNLEIRTLEV